MAIAGLEQCQDNSDVCALASLKRDSTGHLTTLCLFPSSSLEDSLAMLFPTLLFPQVTKRDTPLRPMAGSETAVLQL